MAFGQLVGKWRILKNPLQCRIKKCPMVIHTCIHLHNFIINDKMSNNIDIVEEDETSPIIDCFNENAHILTDARNSSIGKEFCDVLVKHIEDHNKCQTITSG